MRIIIIGAGEVGRNIAQRLSREAKDVVVIDPSESRIRAIREAIDVQALVGSGSSPQVLRDAGIVNAEMLVAVTDSDETNLTAALLTAAYSPNTIKIARLRTPDLFQDQTLLGYEGLRLDLAINPDQEAAARIVQLIEHPWAANLTPFAEGQILLTAVRVTEASLVAGSPLKELPQRVPGRVPLIVARSRGGEVTIPTGKDTVEKGDLIYVVAKSTEMETLAEVMGHKERRGHRVIVGGATRVGLSIARILEQCGGFNVKLLDPSEERCREAAAQLSSTIVLHGAITDQGLLGSEGIEGCDVYVACSNEEELNVLAALLAKRLGAGTAITVNSREEYGDLVSNLGVDALVSPRAAAVGSILHFIRRGRVLRVTSIGAGEAEAIEFEALPTSEVVGRPLRDIRFPAGAIIGAVVRADEVIIPRGNDVIQQGDRVIVFALEKAIRKVERAMSVKIEFF